MACVLVTYLFLLRNIMTKETYIRKHLIEGLLTVWESECIIVIVWSMMPGRQHAWHWSSNWELSCDPQAGGRESESGPAAALFQYRTSSKKPVLPNTSHTVHQLETKHSKVWTYRGCSLSKHHSPNQCLTLLVLGSGKFRNIRFMVSFSSLKVSPSL